jgi:hypothetical protein
MLLINTIIRMQIQNIVFISKMDPRIRIHHKMSWIPNTAYKGTRINKKILNSVPLPTASSPPEQKWDRFRNPTSSSHSPLPGEHGAPWKCSTFSYNSPYPKHTKTTNELQEKNVRYQQIRIRVCIRQKHTDLDTKFNTCTKESGSVYLFPALKNKQTLPWWIQRTKESGSGSGLKTLKTPWIRTLYQS